MSRAFILAVLVPLTCGLAACATATRGGRPPATQNPSPQAITAAPSLADIRRAYDAGKFTDVVAAVEMTPPNDTALWLLYLGGQSYEKLNNMDGARRTYLRLADALPPVWADVGRSAAALVDRRIDDALAWANNAARDPAVAEAHHQRGVVLMVRGQHDEASDAFDRATAIDPSFAAAHYYAGLAYSRVDRVDRMATHWEAFLRLAPDAPERLEVESIMRTVR